jgi:hypothetical protein
MPDLDMGVDLGAAYTKLAVLDRRREPVAPMRATVASAVDDGSGPATENFVAAYGCARAGFRRSSAERPPDESLHGFLTELLRAPVDDRAGRSGPPRRSVVAVPHSWWAGEPSPAAVLEDRLFGGDDVDGRLVSQPLAAAVHLCRRDPTLQNTPLVVCDLGASAARISVCRVVDGRVDLLRYAEVPLGPRLRWFDVDVALADHLLRHRAGPGTDVRRLRHLIGRARAHLVPAEEAALWAGRRALFGAEPYVTAGGYTLTYDDAEAAIAPMIEAAADLAREVAATLPELSGDDAWRVALLGGGALFHPLARAVLDGLGGDAVGIDARLVALDRDTVLAAAAFGAALVAGREADPGDRYPYAVALRARQVTSGRLEAVDVPLARVGELRAGGRSLPGTHRGAPVPIHFADDDREVELIVSDGSGMRRPLRLAPPTTLRGGTFTVALHQRATGECVLLCRSGAAAWREWELGVLPTALRDGV